MAHGRKFRSTRRAPSSERSLFEQKLAGRYSSRTLDRNDLLNLIRGGEDTYIEFKIRLVNIEKITAEVVALANGGGGAMVFGVNDQRRLEGLDDPEQVEEQLIDICRNQVKPPIFPRIDKVSFDNGVRVVVLEVDDRRAPHSTVDNQYYIRIGSTKREADGNELAQLFAKSHTGYFEDLPVFGASVEDIDEALVWSFIRDAEGETFRQPAGFPTADALKDLGLGVGLGAATVRPTLAGLLLFGTAEAIAAAAPQSQLVLTRFSGLDTSSPVVERAEFFGNLGSLFERGMSFIKRYVDLWDSRPSRSCLLNAPGNSKDEPIRARGNYARGAVSEALTNLLVHRNYSMVGSSSRISILDDRIELVNPKRNGDAPKKLVEWGAATRQNPRMHHIFTSPEYGIDCVLRGMPALRRAQYSFTRQQPKLSVLGDELRLELPAI
ncbi:MAG TPA: RNA-binding domain-containing protein [Blastocatellia bacterium]|nr:RNA-binding domain-containing protein [Blastocatellia bacterium]